MGDGLIDIETGQLLVDIVGVDALTLFIFTEQLSEAVCPLQGLIIVLGGDTGIGNIDETCDGVFIRLVAVSALNVGKMLLLGNAEVLFGFLVCFVESHLATADIDQQVHVVAGGVALMRLQKFGSRNGSLQAIFILAANGE